MTAKEALRKVSSKVTGMRATSCYEYDSVFVFQMAPETASDPTRLLSGLTSVDKKTGIIRAFKPFDIPLDEYKRGRVIPISELGGV